MKNILIIGAGGGIAQMVIGMLQGAVELSVTLFLRNATQLRNIDTSRFRIIEADVMNKTKLDEAMKGQEIVYANLAGDLCKMTQNIVEAMKKEGAKHLIFISSIGIYDTPLKPVLRPYREGADVVENSGLDYTILRPSWFTDDNEVDYELRGKGEPENTGVVSRKSLATMITHIIRNLHEYRNKNLNISKKD